MEVSEAIAKINYELYRCTGEQLNPAQEAAITAAWMDRKYEDAAQDSEYSYFYLQRHVGPKLWATLSATYGQKVTKKRLRSIVEEHAGESLRHKDKTIRDPETVILGSSLPSNNIFYGRKPELALLRESILDTQCVLLLGQAGIGKTSLAAQLVERLKYEPQTLDIFLWKPFYRPTALKELVPELLRLLDISHFEEEDLIGQVDQLIEALRKYRILLILDGVDRLLDGKDSQCPYGGSGDYAWFIRTLSIEAHQSCVLLTSREPLPEVAWLNETGQSARIIRLEGLGKDAKNILRVQGLADQDEWGTLIQIYRGNPLSLKMVASRINSFFNGQVSSFLKCKTTWMGEPLRQALDTQFRLGSWSDLERSLMQYLADDLDHLQEEQIAFSQVYETLKERGKIQSMTELMEAIEILCDRSLLERNQSKDSDEMMLSLQPVIKKYVLTDPSGIIQDTLAA